MTTSSAICLALVLGACVEVPPDLAFDDAADPLIVHIATTADRLAWQNAAMDAVTDASGHLYQAGFTSTYNPMGSPSTAYTRTIRKFTAFGMAWSFGISDSPGTSFRAIALGTSAVYGAAFCVPPTGGFGSRDWCIVKLDAAAGTLLWQRYLGTGASDEPTGIAYDTATDRLYVAGAWNGGPMVKVLIGATGVLAFDFAPSAVGQLAIALDPTTGGAGGATLYVVDPGSIGAYDAGTGNWMWGWPLPGTGPSSVDVDLVTGAVCAAGTGAFLVNGLSGDDGWAKRFTPLGVLSWTRFYDAASTERFADVAAKHGGTGCVAVGSALAGSAGFDALTVDYSNGGTVLDVDLYDDNLMSEDDLGRSIQVPASGVLAGKAIVTSDGWSHNGGPVSPMVPSLDAVTRRLAL